VAAVEEESDDDDWSGPDPKEKVTEVRAILTCGV
jgi:hypothetical protein